MSRVRLLAGAAVMTAAVALTNPAHAQFACAAVGSPQPVPPCIVIDITKIATSVEEINQKTQQITQLQEQISKYTDIQGLLGQVNKKSTCTFKALVPIAPLPAGQNFTKITTDKLATLPTTGDDTAEARAEAGVAERVKVRAAAGDGYSIALVAKARLNQLALDAEKIEAAAAKSTDVRTDWQVNTAARSLMLRALANLKEVRAAQGNLVAENNISTTRNTVKFNFARAAAVAVTVAATIPDWGKKLGDIAGLSNKLQALITAKQLSTSYTASIAGQQETQTEYKAVLAAAQQSQAQLQSLAQSEASRKGVSAAALLQRADSIMQSMDRTTWDDPSKSDVAKRAADYAKSQLDKMVPGDVSGSWTDLLRTRAEAYKQEAFFRPINDEAKQWEASDRQAMADYEKSAGFSIASTATLDQQIAQVQSQLAELGKGLDNAPDPIKAQRDSIYKSTMDGSGYDGGPVTN